MITYINATPKVPKSTPTPKPYSNRIPNPNESTGPAPALRRVLTLAVVYVLDFCGLDVAVLSINPAVVLISVKRNSRFKDCNVSLSGFLFGFSQSQLSCSMRWYNLLCSLHPLQSGILLGTRYDRHN